MFRAAGTEGLSEPLHECIMRESMYRAIRLAAAIALMVAPACGRPQPADQVLPAQDTDVPRILIMPFANLGGPDDTYLAAGLSNEIADRLASVSGLGFVSRHRTGSDGDALRATDEIGRNLGVDFLLEGSVLHDRNANLDRELIVESRLLQVADDSVVWNERIVRPIADIFEVQSAIAHAVVEKLDVPLSSDEVQALDVRPTENLEAYDVYLRGRQYSASFEEGELALAEQFLNQAIALDPDFALAHAMLSENHSLIFHWRYDKSPQRLAAANAAARRAREIDPDLPEGHRALGFYYYWGQNNYELALSEFIEAARKRPNDSTISASIGLVLRRQGRWQEALDAMQRSLDMRPEDPGYIAAVASTLARMRRYEEAAGYFRKVIDLSPDEIHPYVYLARIVRAGGGPLDEAGSILDSMPDKDPALRGYYRFEQAMYERDWPRALSELARVNNEIHEPIDELISTRALAECECRVFGSPAGSTPSICNNAREYLEHHCDLSPGDPGYHAALGWAYALNGEKENAIQSGIRAVELSPITTDAMAGHSFLIELAKIYAWVDEPYSAVKTLHTALTTPGWISEATLRHDPVWDPIRDDPRFEELLRMHSGGE